ncbi:hypothetical protein [Chryseobacterium sp.]|uniref:hypothetical protein n=1 Tax=Chryseobacterium sp. TaxID=1871047 RepID=UPI00289667EB|nr:hypothetical protein [Chryseobacterium sp.]
MISIKEKYKKKVVGFNGSATPIGERDDLEILAEIGLRSGDESILTLFKKVPTQEEIDSIKAKKLIEEFKSEK